MTAAGVMAILLGSTKLEKQIPSRFIADMSSLRSAQIDEPENDTLPV